MLTRLKVRGFKNLVEADVSFGPFTCIAGANGVGKSNLFDAITFLGALADRPLMEAAKCVRDESDRATDVRSLFLRLGDKSMDEMSFEAEMLVPPSGQDDFGKTAEATVTFLKYCLVIRYHRDERLAASDRIEIVREELKHINVGDAGVCVPFQRSSRWLKSVVKGKGRRNAPFISTDGDRIRFHQDGVGGRPRDFPAASLPRTVLSSANAAESPTALLARLEMRSWRLLQLEPSALRKSDAFSAPIHVGVDGSHLAATLYHLAQQDNGNGKSGDGGAAAYAQVANQLATLVEDVHDVSVSEDRQRELLTLQVVDRHQNLHAARALSDGTLRFLALSILEMDPGAPRLLCFEEPENGIHPERISAMLRLLKNLTVDTEEPVGTDNPLRQVIVNTHSPAVVGLVDDNDLLVAERQNVTVADKRCTGVGFAWLPDTWRQDAFPDRRPVSRGTLGVYLNPLAFADEPEVPMVTNKRSRHQPRRRVKDRKDLQQMLPFPAQP